MKNKFYIDAMSDETLAKMIDETMRFEKSREAKDSRVGVASLLKLIPAVAVIALVIGLINILPVFNGGGFIAGSEGVDMGEPDIEINLPAAYATEEEADEVDPYAHVRFGETRDILLLEIEWFESGDEYRDWWESNGGNIEDDEFMLEVFARIDDKTAFMAKTVNGKSTESFSVFLNEGTISQYYNSEGYYIFNVYPYDSYVFYRDEGNERQLKFFGVAYSKEEYEIILNNEIIPFCDDLLAQGLMPQENYEHYTIALADPLAYYIDLYF